MKFMFMPLFVSCAIALSFSSVAAKSAQASDEYVADGGIPIAASLITPGRYIAPRPAPFENVVVKQWFSKTMIEGKIMYSGYALPFTVDVKQDPSGPDAFVADGYISQHWTTGVTCSIRLKLEIQRENGRLFIRSYQPSSIFLEAPAGRECQPYNNYTWTFHDKAYVMMTDQP